MKNEGTPAPADTLPHYPAGTISSSYVLVTPTKDEAPVIGETLRSVIAQTHRPLEWVIVSDGSTDGTNAIVRAAAAQHPWIKLLELPPRAGRDFAAVVKATEAGLRALTIDDYEFIGLLDSDVSFGPEYFACLLGEFTAAPRLGLAGGVVFDPGVDRSQLPFNRKDVPGAVQCFRRACFEQLGGLLAIPEGGWDALTCARARMAGFETRLVTHLHVDHLKPRNVAEGGSLRRKWQMGIRDYALGYGPVFQLFKCAGRLRERPWLLAGLAWGLGYLSASLSRRPRRLPPDLMRFVRQEQRHRLLALLRLAR
jgi:biofilm PGA synthesis N-glycosyltransferase PgaC